MATSVRIKDDVYSLLETNAKGYESVSDTIGRALFALEALEAQDMILDVIKSRIEAIKNGDEFREIVLLVHFQKEAVERAMKAMKFFFPSYTVKYVFDENSLKIEDILPVRQSRQMDLLAFK
ncbi:MULTISPECIES: hypothetical protein [Vibrio harveyi group]|uniref:hypothetical protein n=1 Tax=Vibrio harveyi group TaxID=717610 RepID=UPI0004E25C13|nr:hypothetical protein [Vibrio parahaemolyticus]MDF4866482.1 hypothetical protein [Vibrio parahaemolyticus]MDG2809900.1 hypothetical protein [Vibrio parahaemolyticus]MRE11700.1 hypothetical protein [Vibrio parahaemolyticus]NKJ89605.1 hypothetical protein [Vibrio parahaemolyticus]TBT60466.1 hypothetical protein D5E77_24725 [Vibrio parahaemolyticus]